MKGSGAESTPAASSSAIPVGGEMVDDANAIEDISDVAEKLEPESPTAQRRRDDSDSESSESSEFSSLSLHAIDLGRSDQAEMRAELMEQMETVGFLVLSNVPDYDEDRYLAACKALHALPLEAKRALYLQKDEACNANTYRGFQPFKPNDASHKEFFDQGGPMEELSAAERALPLYEETPFPPGAEHEWIREEFQRTYKAFYAAAMRIIGILAEGLGKSADFFNPWFEGGSLSTLRSIHYSPRSQGLVDSSQLGPEDLKLTTPEHADSGFLTFLATFGYPGLQVYVDGVYKSVAPVDKNTLVVNLGDLFARITNYRLKATYHRVLDTGATRYSCPLFVEPKYSARIPVGLLAHPRESADEDIPDDAPCFGDWLVRRFTASYVEWQNFKVPDDRKPFVDAIQLSDFANSDVSYGQTID